MGDIPPPSHSPLNISLILLMLATFVLTATFNALPGSGAGAAQARCRWNLTPMNCERRAGPGFAPRQISLIHHL